jgi:spore germination cell wall hydrolase CwlJ-like protein
MRIQDQVMLALTVWRENRSHGIDGMQSVANVILNRAAKRSTNVWTECTRRLQFSSVTAPGDPELTLWPSDGDRQWVDALDLAAKAAAGALDDLTDGALLYYEPHSIKTSQTIEWLDGTRIPFPETWNESAVTPLCSIGGHCFFR